MYFHAIFDNLSFTPVTFLFACLLVFSGDIAFSSILRIKTIFFGRYSVLREIKSQQASSFELTRTLTKYGEHGIMAHIP